MVLDVGIPFEDLFEPETQLNAQCRASPSMMTGTHERYRDVHDSMVHQSKSRGPTSHVNSKLMLMSMSMSMLMSSMLISSMMQLQPSLVQSSPAYQSTIHRRSRSETAKQKPVKKNNRLGNRGKLGNFLIW